MEIFFIRNWNVTFLLLNNCFIFFVEDSISIQIITTLQTENSIMMKSSRLNVDH